MDFFDLHADTLTEIRCPGESLRKNDRDLDLDRVDAFAGSYAQVFAVWEDAAKSDRSLPAEENFRRLFGRAWNLLCREEAGERSARPVWICESDADMKKALAEGKSPAFLSVEDVSLMGEEIWNIRSYHVRFAMLCWNYQNQYACGAACCQESGLTDLGREAARFLMDQGLVLDVSHLSDQGIEDLFKLSDNVLIASHSNARQVRDNPRNLRDDQIREIIRRKGLIGLNLFAPFVGEKPGLEDLARHIDHILELGGENALAMGQDLDGSDGLFPKPFKGVQSEPELYTYLSERFGSRMADRIFWENAEKFIERML